MTSAADFSPELFNVVRLMSDFDKPWAVCGGWALDLFLNRMTRPHKDIDIAILRRDQLTAQTYLGERGWSYEIARDGKFIPWPNGEFIHLPLHTIWCRQPHFVPGFLEVLLNEADDTYFLFRRDTTISLALDRAFLLCGSGMPILAPEIVLLYKSSDAAQEKNADDFRQAAPALDTAQRVRLKAALAAMNRNHQWLNEL